MQDSEASAPSVAYQYSQRMVAGVPVAEEAAVPHGDDCGAAAADGASGEWSGSNAIRYACTCTQRVLPLPLCSKGRPARQDDLSLLADAAYTHSFAGGFGSLFGHLQGQVCHQVRSPWFETLLRLGLSSDLSADLRNSFYIEIYQHQ